MDAAADIDDEDAEFRYIIPLWHWEKSPHSVLRAARALARRRRMRADGEPQPYVLLVWPQDLDEPSNSAPGPAATPKRRPSGKPRRHARLRTARA